jgi:hypothetical protein
MQVAMMKIGPVGMSMGQRGVLVRMLVPDTRRGGLVVLVLMMPVVMSVPVGMDERFVLMIVAV